MKKILVMLLVMLSSFSFSQKLTYTDEFTNCTFICSYDTAKYNRVEILNCYLLSQTDFFDIKNIPIIFSHDDVIKFNIKKLDDEYKRKLNMLDSLDLPKTTFWKKLKENKKKYIYDVYFLCQTVYFGYFNPEKLRNYNKLDKNLIRISNAIIFGGDSLLLECEKSTKNKAKLNKNPDYIITTYNKLLKSSDKYIQAKIELIMFDFWNIANNNIERPTDNQLDIIEKEYYKLFIKVEKIGCTDIY